MKIMALSLLLSTSFLIGMLNENSTQEEINKYNAEVNQLRQALLQDFKEKKAQDKRIERTENPLTRFLLALHDNRESFDGPSFDVPYDWRTRNTEQIEASREINSKRNAPKIIVSVQLKTTGVNTIAAVKAEFDKIAQQCREQEKTVRPIAANVSLFQRFTLKTIADEFASATFSLNDNELLWEITASFPSEKVYKLWSDYKTYIPYK